MQIFNSLFLIIEFLRFQIHKKSSNGHSISVSSDDDMIDITTSGSTTERIGSDNNDDFIGHGETQ